MIVPFTVTWTAENTYDVRPCRWANGERSIWQPSIQGQGEPQFAKPHSVRQRKAMATWSCDICGEEIPPGKRISLSMEDPRIIDRQLVALQVEPCLHPACAIVALTNCPRLRQRKSLGLLKIRRIGDANLIAQWITPKAVEEFTGKPWRAGPVVGHLKLQITHASAPISEELLKVLA